jgi:hypothetical protein
MNRLLNWLRRSANGARRSVRSARSFLPEIEMLGRAPSWAPAARRQPVQPELETLEARDLLSSSGVLSAITDCFGNHVAFAIGGDHAIWENVNSTGWFRLGGWVTCVSAAQDAGGHAEVFAIASDHSPWLRDSGGWHALGGCVIDISGTWNNEVYAIAGDHSPWVHNAVTGWHNLGGYVLQLSAGLDYVGNDVVWAIAGDHSLWLNDTKGWHYLGGWVSQISANVDYSVFAIAGDHSVWWTSPYSGWYDLGGYATQIEVGRNSSDLMDEVFAIGAAGNLEVWDGANWRNLGGYVTTLAGTGGQDDLVYALASDHSVWLNQAKGWGTNTWYDLGGYVL